MLRDKETDVWMMMGCQLNDNNYWMKMDGDQGVDSILFLTNFVLFFVYVVLLG